MAKQTRTNLATRAGTIASEQTTGANTAPKVGGLLNDIVDTFATEFEPTRSYKPGEYIIWNNRNVRCLQATTAGQSPSTHPVKWDDKVIDSVEKLGPLGDNFPVLAAALKAYVTNAVANGPAGEGSPRKATLEELNEKLNDTAYVTPYLVGVVTDALLALITDGVSGKDLLELAQDAAVNTVEHPSQIGAVKEILSIKLSELINLETSDNLVFKDGNGNIIIQYSSSNGNPRGLFLNGPGGGFVGRYPDGSFGFRNAAGQWARYMGREFWLDADLIRAQASHINLRSIDLSIAPVASKVSPMMVLENDTVTGSYHVRVATPDQMLAYLLPSLNAYLDTLDLSGGMDGDSRPVLGIYCYEAAPPSGDPLTYQDFDISPAMIGVMQSHNLQVSANLIYPVLTDSEYRNAFDYMSIVFTGTTGFTITGPSDFTGQLHLQKRNLAS